MLNLEFIVFASGEKIDHLICYFCPKNKIKNGPLKLCHQGGDCILSVISPLLFRLAIFY